eukprot:NODE_960_length_2743_cov_0.177005.p2 type:complete len:257 gc:universal NODE_960_length_2743_cov_0.177005:2006-1236(-)
MQIEELLGTLAVVFYSLVLMPQIVNAIKNHSMPNMSFATLLLWTCGDSLNLISAVLLDQIFAVKSTASLFVSIDLTTILLYLYYEKWKRPNERLYQLKIRIYYIFGILIAPSAVSGLHTSVNLIDGRNNIFFSQEYLGSCLAWGCAFLYFGSRIPQILLFYSRHNNLEYRPIYPEDEGIYGNEIVVDEDLISPIKFNSYVWIFMICANCLYSSSLIIMETQKIWSLSEFVSRTLPYLIGSGGTIPLDIFILYLGIS